MADTTPVAPAMAPDDADDLSATAVPAAPEAPNTDAPEAAPAETVQSEAAPAEIVQSEAAPAETVQSEVAPAETVRSETVRPETVRPETAARPALVVPGAATGRRKEAIARVRIVPGTGQWRVNGRRLEEYFPNKVHQQLVAGPFAVLELDGRYDVVARLHGGGISGQAGALRLGIARALNGIDEDNNRPVLKKAGFLTRDARAKERKKYGLKKARKAPQYSKR